MKTSDYLPQRNRNLRKEFYNLLGKADCVSDIFQLLTVVPAERFYISEERAYLLLLYKRKGNEQWDRKMLPNRRRMIIEIDKRVDAYLASHPGVSLRRAVAEVVNSPAPSFFLDAKSIRTIFYAFCRKNA